MPYAMRRSVQARLVLLSLTTALCTGLPAPASAQVAGQAPGPAVRQPTDDFGVDVIHGTLTVATSDVSIGPAGPHGLSYGRVNGLATQAAWIEASGSGFLVVMNGRSDRFDGNYASTEGHGATLSNQSGIYVYTAADGTVARFATNQGYSYTFYEGEFARLADITYPDGTRHTFTWRVQTYCPDGYYYPDGQGPDRYQTRSCQSATYYVARLQAVESSAGYQLKLSYANNDATLTGENYGDWGRRLQVTALNTTIERCDPVAFTCATSGNWPASTYFGDMDRDALGRQIKTYVTTTTDSEGRVATATLDGVTRSYAYADADTIRTTTVTDPLGHSSVYVGDMATSLINSFRDPEGRTTAYEYDGNGRLTKTTMPEQNTVSYAYDGRGNVVQTTASPKPGSSAPTIATSAGYDTGCANPKVCNRPVWTRDARGNQTDYGYDGTHGGVVTVTAPAGAGGVRPQVRYGYTALNPYIKASAGGTPSAAGAIYVPTSVSVCRTLASCAGGADETRTTIGYGPQSAGTGNNLLPVSRTTAAGDGSVSATTTATYDAIGNVATVDGPQAGSGDTTRLRYDAARQLVGAVGPDPDGPGPLKNRAARVTYNDDGQQTLAEAGTVASQSDGDWSGFSSLQQQATAYANRRPVSATVTAGGTVYGVTGYGYDGAGRVICMAVRMDPAQWNGQSDYCSPQTSGPNGPDRVTQRGYDAAGRVTTVVSAFGTAEATTERTGYTANGQTASVTDGNGNVTTQGYDGHDRVSTTTYPGGSYEQLTYDAGSNVVSRRLRDGQSIGYTYDALGRVVAKDRPNGTYWETDQSYAYDNLGQLTGASDSNGRQLSFTYDALGRKTGQGDSWYGFGNATFQYDAGGRRTRFAWGDGNWVGYDYLVTGETSAIRDSAGTALSTYGYDDLGRRTSLTRANGTSTSYAYDAASRLTQLTQDLGGTASDLTLGFGYNPAGQITGRTASNDAYAWTGAYNVDRSYGVNGLNQLTNAGATALGYDGRGNLTSSGSSSYGYTVDNQLATAPGVGLAYDPVGRLFNFQESGVNTTLLFDGADVIAEVDQSNGGLLRRYIQGPGSDEPLIWYEGAGFADQRYLHADERGSVVAVSDAAGNTLRINTYDEFGIPGANNLGRFQYTGQKWLPSVGLYDYKARMYSPTLGRFLQTDPIGYADGLNWYNYTGSDPVNGTDPSGTCEAAGNVKSNNCVKPIDPIYASMLSSASLANLSSNIFGVLSSTYNGSTGQLIGTSLRWYIDSAASSALSTFSTSTSMGNIGFGDFNTADLTSGGSGSVAPQNANDGSVLESTRKGERGRAATNQGTPDPYKHMKPAPGKPGFGQVKDPQTGRLSGPKPWPTDPRLGPQTSNYAPLVALGAGVVIMGGVIFFPEFFIPGLVFGTLATQ